MKQITTWRPDTCECVVGLEWGDTLSEEFRTHTPVRIWPCQKHDDGLKATEDVISPARQLTIRGQTIDIPKTVARLVHKDKNRLGRMVSHIAADNGATLFK